MGPLHLITTCELWNHPTSLVSAHVKLKFDTNVTEKSYKTMIQVKKSVSYLKIYIYFLALQAWTPPPYPSPPLINDQWNSWVRPRLGKFNYNYRSSSKPLLPIAVKKKKILVLIPWSHCEKLKFSHSGMPSMSNYINIFPRFLSLVNPFVSHHWEGSPLQWFSCICEFACCTLILTWGLQYFGTEASSVRKLRAYELTNKTFQLILLRRENCRSGRVSG